LDEFDAPPKQEEKHKRSSPAPQNEEQYSPSGDSGHDTIGELQSATDNLPASESVSSGMRDLSPELTTFERSGPLTIPTSATQKPPSAPPANVDEFDDYPRKQPRPPTPPKDLHDFGEENPKSIDLGPPLHHMSQRSSEHGLHSILKHSNEKAWVDFRSIPGPGWLQLYFSGNIASKHI
jgi:hypothetical protein